MHSTKICPKGSKVEVIYCIRDKVEINNNIQFTVAVQLARDKFDTVRQTSVQLEQPRTHPAHKLPSADLTTPTSTRCSIDRDFFAVVDLALTERLDIKHARNRDGAVWSNTSPIKEIRLEGKLRRLSCELQRRYWMIDLWVPRTGARTCSPL